MLIMSRVVFYFTKVPKTSKLLWLQIGEEMFYGLNINEKLIELAKSCNTAVIAMKIAVTTKL